MDLIIVCAWCQPEQAETDNITHGICPDCAKKMKEELACSETDPSE